MQKLSSEIHIKIFENIDTIDDLINFYDISYNNKTIINDEVDKYLKLKNKIKEKKRLFKILFPIEHKIREYIHEDDKTTKEIIIKKLKKMYNKSDLYKRIIDYYLTCDICGYKHNYNINGEYNYKTFHECINCDNILCSKCCIGCDFCSSMDDLIFHHCLNCRKECLKIIRMNIIKIDEYLKYNIDYEMENDVLSDVNSDLDSDKSDSEEENIGSEINEKSRIIKKRQLRKLKLKYCKNIINLAYDNKIRMDMIEKIDYAFNILNRKDYEEEKNNV